ncbi:SIT4 phosphatase-associated protein-domain-containing protein [Mycotypha africana]|uniref:SIT4 phosphatase-associated protein-domain-containing protein n=1 Tax=Mycotypha africana TaxID=64632 RepID=UPI00230056FC|nr:SIT4 phosphatase-associated protein-domain-containing protein [Mycotypha africana]KAI8991637.1 SIT4 phosphatase-associated protein-domain-containing protein [Mycotypha africana]
MFWRFGFNNSTLETLLEKDNVTLEEVLEEDDILQEAKSQNPKLVDFLSKTERIESLLNYITATDLDESKKFKYPFIASEIIACEIQPLIDAIVIDHKDELLTPFWSYLNTPALPRQRASPTDDRTSNSHKNQPDTKTEQDREESTEKEAQEAVKEHKGQVLDKETRLEEQQSTQNTDISELKQERKDELEEEQHTQQQKLDHGLDSLQASYFCKTIGVLLSKYPVEMMAFIQSDAKNLDKILGHLHTSAIMDLLLTLVRMEELPEGKGVVKWLSDHKLLENLIERLDPYLDTEEHSIAQQCICEIIRMSQTSLPDSPSIGMNDLIMNLKSEATMRKLVKYMLDPEAPNATSTLINGVSIIIDMIRHNNSDLENDPATDAPLTSSSLMPTLNNESSSVSLAEMLKVMGDHVPELTHLLLKPRSVKGPIRMTLGEVEPLGFERLKICELFAELLHCSNMSNLNNFNQQIQNQHQQQSRKQDEEEETTATTTTDTTPPPLSNVTKQEEELSVGDYLKSKFVENRTMPICVDLFFAFPWNNFLHYVIYDMLHQVFNGRMDVGLNRNLAISILKDGQLTDKIVIAQKANDEECAKPKGMRAGYMGHLTFISDEIMKLFEGYPETIVVNIKDDIDMEGWNHYCHHELKQTKERDQLPLGGLRPNDDDELDLPQTDDDEELDDDDDDDDDEDDEDVLSGISDGRRQYSRFLSRNNNEAFDDDEEEAEHWISGRDDFNKEYTYNVTSYGMNGHGGSSSSSSSSRSSNAGNIHHENEEEYDSDPEEAEDDSITPDWTRNFNKYTPPNTLRRIVSYNIDRQADLEDEEDYDDEFDHLADAEELERRAALRNATYKIASSLNNEGEKENIYEDDTTTTTTQNEAKPVVEDHFVRAVKTKEERINQPYPSQSKQSLDEESEQEGEV